MSLIAWVPALAQSSLSSFGAWVFLSIEWAEPPYLTETARRNGSMRCRSEVRGYWFCLWSGSGRTQWEQGDTVDTGLCWGWGSLKRTEAALPALRDGTDLLDFFDVTVFVIGGDGLGGLDALIVLEQRCDLQQKHGPAAGGGGWGLRQWRESHPSRHHQAQRGGQVPSHALHENGGTAAPVCPRLQARHL